MNKKICRILKDNFGVDAKLQFESAIASLIPAYEYTNNEPLDVSNDSNYPKL